VNTTETLASSPSASALANLADAWQAMRSRLVALNDKLTRRATLAQQRVQQIETMRAAWAATRASAGEAAAPSTVLEQIDATMAVIAGARRNADDGLAHVLALQDRTVKEIARCDEVLARVAKTGNALLGPLVAPDTLPIWGSAGRVMRAGRGPAAARSRPRHDRADADYIRGEMGRLPLQIAIRADVQLDPSARRGRGAAPTSSRGEAAAAQVFGLPLPSALVVTLSRPAGPSATSARRDGAVSIPCFCPPS
jgi:hypothetical protein